MDPVVLSPTAQAYRGVTYYLCGRYLQRDGVRLHRLVYADHHGFIPPGHDVHHVDHDRLNNAASNLKALPEGDHQRHHNAHPTPAMVEARLRQAREVLGPANALLTTDQRAAAAVKGWDSVALSTVTCEGCGGDVVTPFPGRTRFCGGTCRQRVRRARLRG